jgi:hypothetical protein
MAAWALWAAAGWAVMIAVVHVFAGGRDVSAPVAACDALARDVRAVAQMCWHFTTSAILAMAAAFAAGALWDDRGVVIAATLLAAAFVVVGTAVALRSGVALAKVPQGPAFLPLVLLGGWAIT